MVSSNIVVITVCLFALTAVSAHPAKRQVDTDENKKSDDRICGASMPCGWAVYNPVSRYIDYFMKNNCNCTAETQCVRDDDDISINAFVYKCKNEKH